LAKVSGTENLKAADQWHPNSRPLLDFPKTGFCGNIP